MFGRTNNNNNDDDDNNNNYGNDNEYEYAPLPCTEIESSDNRTEIETTDQFERSDEDNDNTDSQNNEIIEEVHTSRLALSNDHLYENHSSGQLVVRSSSAITPAQQQQLVVSNQSRYEITGHKLVKLLEEDRKLKTLNMGFVGGAFGLLFLGPVGALLFGSGFAVATQRDLKQREDIVRWQLEGRMHEPLSRVASEHAAAGENPNEFLATQIVKYSGKSGSPANQYLQRLEKQRKRATVTMGIVGGTIGLILLGPVGAVLIGASNAIVTKYSMKIHENATRRKLLSDQASINQSRRRRMMLGWRH